MCSTMWHVATATIFARIRASVFASLLIVGIVSGSHLQALEREQYQRQRALFTEVEGALKRGDRQPFLRHGRGLAAYPLYPYLVYQDLLNRLSHTRHENIEAFLQRYGDEMPLADKLRHRWLEQLAQQGRWSSFLLYYKESPVVIGKENRCNHARALIHTGQVQQARAALEALWLVNFSQPKQCDPVFRYGFERGIIDDRLVWQRALLVWGRGEEKLMEYLGNKLRGAPRHWFDALREARRNPRQVATMLGNQWSGSPYARDVLVFAMRRLIRQDVVEAERVWREIKSTCAGCLLPGEVERDMGIAAAQRLLPQEAYRLLSGLPRQYHTQASRYWRVRAALRTEEWQLVLAALDDLEAKERTLSQWSYWQARALAASGKHREARSIWEQLASGDDYYGYLSADRLGRAYPYAVSHIKLDSSDVAGLLAAYPAVARIHELLILGRGVDANRELLPLMERFDATERLKFGALADRWSWPIGAIRSLADSDLTRYRVERFPLPYRDLVSAESRRSQVSAEWIYGIMRRESAFVEDVRSSAGALGLMQLLPATARQVGSRLGMRKLSTFEILSPGTNIRLGTTYIKSLHQRNDGNIVVSLAGYNAGPTNARRWLNTTPVSDMAVWVDTIPFDETRLYVRAVLFYALIYRHRLGKSPVRLSELMNGATNMARFD